jgi:hypothetical protein
VKAIIPRGFKQLKQSDQNKLMALAEAQVSKNCTIMLDIYLKMSCMVLNEAFGFGEERLNRYLGNFRRAFTKQAKLVKNGKQNADLDAKIRKIFRKKGYPDDFFKTIVSDWDIDTKENNE